MKNALLLSINLLFLLVASLNAQNKLSLNTAIVPFQGTKHFCSFLKPVKYDVTIKGNKVSIIYTYKGYVKKITGTFVNGQLFTNDAEEKRNKGYTGRYYKISKTFLAVNNLEGGDYVEFNLCK